MRSRRTFGFTLIELMIVVGIVGILAAIAIPTYNDYLVRARVTELLHMGAFAKTSVSEYWISEHAWPSDAKAAGLTEISTPLVQSLSVHNGTITVSGNEKNLGADVELIFEPKENQGTIIWTCKSTPQSQAYVPASCRTQKVVL